jgi:hypothetical protein
MAVGENTRTTASLVRTTCSWRPSQRFRAGGSSPHHHPFGFRPFPLFLDADGCQRHQCNCCHHNPYAGSHSRASLDRLGGGSRCSGPRSLLMVSCRSTFEIPILFFLLARGNLPHGHRAFVMAVRDHPRAQRAHHPEPGSSDHSGAAAHGWLEGLTRQKVKRVGAAVRKVHLPKYGD